MQNDQPLRILHVLDHSVPLMSGYAMRSSAIIRAQRALGWDTFHLTSAKQGGADYPEALVDGIAFYRCAPLNGHASRLPVIGHLLLIWQLARRIMEISRETRPDVLHAHSPVLNAVAALAAGRRLRIPVVYEVRAFWEDAALDHGTSRRWGPRYWLTRQLETWALRRSASTATICQGLRGELIERGLPADKVRVVPNAVDIASFMPQRQRDLPSARSLGLEGCTVIGFAGSFYAYEGLLLLLHALPAMLARHAELRLLLVGGGPQEAALRNCGAGAGTLCSFHRPGAT